MPAVVPPVQTPTLTPPPPVEESSKLPNAGPAATYSSGVDPNAAKNIGSMQASVTKPNQELKQAPRFNDDSSTKMSKIDEAREIVKTKGWSTRNEIVAEPIREAGKTALKTPSLSVAMTDAEADAVRMNLSGEELKSFNDDYKKGKFSKPLSDSDMAKFSKVINDDKSTYWDLNDVSKTARHYTYKGMASADYAAYKGSGTKVANLSAKPLNIKG